MLIRDIVDLIDGKILIGHDKLDCKIKSALGSDLMSDVLAYGENGAVLLTGLINNQVIRTAEMLDLKAIIFVRGKIPYEDVLLLGKENDIALITTNNSLYTTSGILYSNGLKGILIK